MAIVVYTVFSLISAALIIDVVVFAYKDIKNFGE